MDKIKITKKHLGTTGVKSEAYGDGSWFADVGQHETNGWLAVTSGVTPSTFGIQAQNSTCYRILRRTERMKDQGGAVWIRITTFKYNTDGTPKSSSEKYVDSDGGDQTKDMFDQNTQAPYTKLRTVEVFGDVATGFFSQLYTEPPDVWKTNNLPAGYGGTYDVGVAGDIMDPESIDTRPFNSITVNPAL